MFTLKIKTDNAAFADGNTVDECRRILDDVGERLARGDSGGAIMDLNGNRVGTFALTHREG